MSHARARQAIEIKLMAWAAARPIRVANFEQAFEAQLGETYLQAFQLPGATTCRYLGGEAYEYTGVYQVSIVCPAGQPLVTAENLIHELSSLFRVDSALSRNGFEGLVTEPFDQGPTIPESATYTVPASFTYRGVADQPPAGA
ncbi:phage tail terminator-like protein [Pseudomonas sp. DCB_CB]|uniref:phage tail terminator-like protein n=1 Tax=unclassified Pseudomonas TaxID=196821 RepID=UPI002248BABB|nr:MULTISPECIES: phage tail terminator-like protein [unclassified Pseudomonas]MCX2691918.1 phage tail terminator-like protein [Pseudomonas sp. DCB_BZ]MCX2857259.1 phage tail terminator-like protein [Pseudomonas sp. DCB_CB]